MAILPEEVEQLAVVDIQNVNANCHIHGQVVHVLVQVLINMLVAEQDTPVVVELPVMGNIRVALVLVDMNGQEVVVVEIVINMSVR